MSEQSNQPEQQKKCRIKVTTPVGTWVSVPEPYEEIEGIVDGITSKGYKSLSFSSEEGSVFIPIELMKQSVLEVLEEIQDNPEVDPEGWTENTGIQPVDDNVLVDVKFDNGYISNRFRADYWLWHLSDITHWRLSK